MLPRSRDRSDAELRIRENSESLRPVRVMEKTLATPLVDMISTQYVTVLTQARA